jgi:hypothetical protein
MIHRAERAIARGVSFDDIHSFYDLNLILSHVEIPPAKVKTNYIDIPGADGAIDATDAHGETRYYDREIKFTFSMLPTDILTWEEKQTQISNVLNGRKFAKITLDKDKGYYFTGRVTVEEHNRSKKLRQIVVKATVNPWKYKQTETIYTKQLTATAVRITLCNSRKPICPEITCTGETTITFGNYTSTLSAGVYKILDLRLVEGESVLTVSGSGTVTFRYTEADL